AGAVGSCAVQLAHRAGAFVIASVRSSQDGASVRRGGADEVVTAADDTVERVLAIAPGGVDHIVESAFDANIAMDARLLAQGGSIGADAPRGPHHPIPSCPLPFN